MSFEKHTPLAADGSQTTLLRYGLPTCLITILLAFLGSDPMRLAVLSGAVLAYAITRKRAVYPFGRILSSVPESPADGESQNSQAKLEYHKTSLTGIALCWFLLLMVACSLSMVLPLVRIDSFIAPDLIDRITGISTVAAIVSSHLAQTHKAMVTQYFAAALRILDHVILLSLSLFFSVTGSSCLYWFFIHYKAGRNQELTACDSPR